MSHTFEDVTAVRVPAGVLKVAEGFFLVTGSFFEICTRTASIPPLQHVQPGGPGVFHEGTLV